MGVPRQRWIRLSLSGVATTRWTTLAEPLLAFLIFCAVFALHARWIFTHFSGDGYLCDSGWLAHLFEAADPLLRNPSGVVGEACAGINARSFLAHHLSPHIFLFGAPLSRVFGLSGVEILAVHQGLFFGVFFVSLYLVVAAARLPYRYKIVGLLSAILVGTLSNVLFQAAAYPHYETALLALSSLGIAAWLRGYRRLFLFCLLWLPLVREDGGFNAAFVCLACIAIEHGAGQGFGRQAPRLARFAAIEMVVSAGAFLAKAVFFPGFDAFSKNFAGQSWDHVSLAFTVERIQAVMASLNTAPVLVGCVLLAVFDVRYASGVVLLAPLYLLHVLSVRPEHGHFALYYALPWLLPATIWLAVFARRAKASAASVAESALVVLLAVAMAAPFQAAIGATGQSWYVAKWALTRPVTNTDGMKDFALWVRRTYSTEAGDGALGKRQCTSMGIAALIPNDLDPPDVLETDSDLSACRTVLLLRRDMQYLALIARAEAQGFVRVAERHNAELWLMSENR